MQKEFNHKSVISCPECSHKKEIVMPVNSCQILYKCENCSKEVKPKDGDCCVFCSYGTEPCPYEQYNRAGNDPGLVIRTHL